MRVRARVEFRVKVSENTFIYVIGQTSCRPLGQCTKSIKVGKEHNKYLASLHDYFNRARLSIEAFFQPIKGN